MTAISGQKSIYATAIKVKDRILVEIPQSIVNAARIRPGETFDVKISETGIAYDREQQEGLDTVEDIKR